jgi:hypothetical protein
MTRIHADYSASAYAINLPLNKKTQSDFSAMLASATSAAQASVSVAGTASASSSDFTSQLNAALRDYGIDVPPALRVSMGQNGLELAGDNRNAEFQAMLRDRPDLANGFSGLLGQAQTGRQTALESVMSAFAGNNPSASVRNFLDAFEASEKAGDYSVRFNGADASVEEKDGNGWQPVKNEQDFRSDLLRAYTEYLRKTQVVSVSDQKKDKDEADDALRQQLADAKQKDGVASA